MRFPGHSRPLLLLLPNPPPFSQSSPYCLDPAVVGVDAKLQEAGRTRHDNGLALLEFAVTLTLFYGLVIANMFLCSFVLAILLGAVTGRLGFIMHAVGILQSHHVLGPCFGRVM